MHEGFVFSKGMGKREYSALGDSRKDGVMAYGVRAAEGELEKCVEQGERE